MYRTIILSNIFYRHSITWSYLIILSYLNMFYYSCNWLEDDLFRPCFNCEDSEVRSAYQDYFDDYIEFISQEREGLYLATRQNARVICRKVQTDNKVADHARIQNIKKILCKSLRVHAQGKLFKPVRHRH